MGNQLHKLFFYQRDFFVEVMIFCLNYEDRYWLYFVYKILEFFKVLGSFVFFW